MSLRDATHSALNAAERRWEQLTDAAHARLGPNPVPILLGSMLLGVFLARLIKASGTHQEVL